ncbi:listerin E3 ubiquitin protein ligase 1 [Desmophyllum pertusum]|uniref:E3 ubiquitin-protein ligase listerin n=1 Tax=Desmophyllum pertusum TaxID=174260 RepID=A0A9W9ZLK4_9CNID|nr:listerin E3 ubiquitin protein ligase 1 [Desmophyllum pertusum]
MGGKDKQRTKGNVKPSSSGRAAALISKDGTVGFVGFGGLQGSPGASNLGYVPMTAGVGEDVDASVDAEFRMVMRKLMKRDSVTKLKAVQEFTDLCKNSTVDAVESALPFWPRLFNKLAMDIDHRVREATQQAMEQLVLRVGRNLAPHLRYIIGPWLCSQFDTYAVVASSGKKSFKTAFSEEKQIEVIMFCRKELFEFLQDNILSQTPSTLSDPKFVSEEEMEAKYNRVLSSSILGLGQLIHVTSSNADADMEELFLDVLRQNKFWKYARHKSPNVRGAVFSMVSVTCEILPSMMLSLSSQVSPAVLSALDDSDPAVCQQLWNVVLSVLKNITDCWKQVNVRKAVLPKLWSVLKNGGSGCASIIFPNLLPFLSKVPSEVIGSGVGFYQEFFISLQEGLTKERVLNSPSECSAVIAAFMECLRFCLLRDSDSDGPDVAVQEYLIKEQLLSVLKISLEKQSKLLQSNLYPLVADLLSYLSIKSETDPKSDEEVEEQKLTQRFCHILKWFWEGFSFVCLENLNSVVGQVVGDDVVNSVSHCLVTLKCPSNKKKRQQKVAFTEMSSSAQFGNDSCESRKCHPSSESLTAGSVETLYNGCLLHLVCNICSLCLNEISQNNSLSHLKLLSCVVPHFTSTKLIKTLLKNTSEQSSTPAGSDSYSLLTGQFVNHTLFPWIKSCHEQSLSGHDIGNVSGVFTDNRSVDYIIAIFCGIIRTLPFVKQVELVSESLQQHTAISFLYKVLEKGLHSEVPGVVRWLQSKDGSEKLLELSRCLVVHFGQDTALSEEDRMSVWKLLKLCIVTERNVAMLENELVDKICQHFLRILRQSEQENEQQLLLLLNILRMSLAHCENNAGDIVHSTEELLLAVFQLQLADTVSSPTVSQSLAETWRTGLKVFRQFPSDVDSTPCQALLLKTAVLIQEKLVKVETLERLDNLASIAVCLLKDASHLSSAEELKDESLSQRVFTALTPSGQQLNFLRNEYPMSQWLLAPLLERRLPVMSDAHDQLDECPRSTLTNHHKMIVFSSTLVKEMLSDANESSVVTRDCFIRLWLETSWVRHWCTCVLGCSDVTEEFTAYSNNSDQTVFNLLMKLRQTSDHLLEHIREKHWSEALLAFALTRSRSEGFLWCLVLGSVLKDLQLLGVPYEADFMLTEVQSFASLEEKECQTLTTLIAHVDGIYELKVITEQYTRLLREENDESAFARVFAVIDGSLHQWFKQTKGVEEALLEYQLTITEILDELVEWNKIHDNLLLMNSSLDDASMSVLTINMSLIRTLEMAVLHCPDKMNSKHWDFMLCSLAGWLQTCEENRSILTSLKCVAVCCQVSSLFCTVARFFEENASKLSKISDDGLSSETSHEVESGSSLTVDTAEFPPNLFAEWQEFFSGTLFNTVLQLFLFHSAQCQSAHFEASLWSNRISESLGSAVIYTPTPLLKEHKFEGPPHATAKESSNMPQWIGDLLEHCLPLLSLHGLQFATYHLLSKVMSENTFLDEQEPESEQRGDEPIRSPPTPLISLINTTCAHMTEMVSDAHVPFGEHLDMTSDTEAQNVSLALMLAWKLLLQFFRNLPQERRVEYAKYIRQNKMVASLLGVLFRLIPLKPAALATAMVADDFEPQIGRFSGQRTIQQLACGVYYSLTQWMPAIVRQWWNGLDKRQSAIVDKFTTSSITPQLCQREMQLVQSSSIRFDNMQVKTRPSAREVAAVYTVDEISMELVVKLAPNHPLGWCQSRVARRSV